MRRLSEWEKGWLAGITDGDGYWRMTKRRFWSKLLNDWRYRYTYGLSVVTTNPAIPLRCYQITGIGKLKMRKNKNHKELLEWSVGANGLRELIPEILPYCVKIAPRIILEALKITGEPRISIKGVKGGYMRKPEYTKRLFELHHSFLQARDRENQPSIYADIQNPELSLRSLELRDLR